MSIVFGRSPIFKEMEELMDQLLRRRLAPASYQRLWAPRVDVLEAGEEFVAIVDLAGVDQGAVTIEVSEQEVAIVGERTAPVGPQCEGSTCLQLEIPYGPFERRIVLPERVDASQATAAFDEGILTIHLPKAGPERRVQVPIQ